MYLDEFLEVLHFLFPAIESTLKQNESSQMYLDEFLEVLHFLFPAIERPLMY